MIVCVFVNGNKNYTPLSRLPTYKDKKKWEETVGTQNYLCKKCGRQFIDGHALRYKGCRSYPAQKLLLPLVRGLDIRDTAEIENISIKKLLSVLLCSRHMIQPRRQYYDCLEEECQALAHLCLP
jgi:transposase-like protein